MHLYVWSYDYALRKLYMYYVSAVLSIKYCVCCVLNIVLVMGFTLHYLLFTFRYSCFDLCIRIKQR